MRISHGDSHSTMTDAALNRALSEHFAAMARKGNRKRWGAMTKKQKTDATDAMRKARWAKAQAAKRNGGGR